MLINSAGYKVLTSVEQYLELVNTSLPGECGGVGFWGSPLIPMLPSIPSRWEGVVLWCGVTTPYSPRWSLHWDALLLVSPGMRMGTSRRTPPPLHPLSLFLCPSARPSSRRHHPQIGEHPHPEVPHGFPPHPLAPLRPALLLLPDDWQRAGEVGSGVPGLRAALQQR